MLGSKHELMSFLVSSVILSVQRHFSQYLMILQKSGWETITSCFSLTDMNVYQIFGAENLVKH